MHHSLANLQKRVLPDSNVLLDAAFVADGLARQSIKLLASLDFKIIICESIENEAQKKLRFFKSKLCLGFDPVSYFTEYLGRLNKLYVPPAAPELGQGVNSADRHVAAAAHQYDAWVLTSDAPLIIETQKIGIHARFPWDVMMEAAKILGTYEQLKNIIRVVAPSRQKGLIFARVIPGNWAGQKGIGHYTICDIENIGRVYYDTQSESWIFGLVTGVNAVVKCPLIQDVSWVVCGVYNLPGSGQQGKVTIRAASSPSSIIAGSIGTLSNFSSADVGQISFGHSIRGESQWNGWLRDIIIGPHAMSKETWKAIVSIPEGAPNPYDSNSLEAILRKMESRYGQSKSLIMPLSENESWKT